MDLISQLKDAWKYLSPLFENAPSFEEILPPNELAGHIDDFLEETPGPCHQVFYAGEIVGGALIDFYNAGRFNRLAEGKEAGRLQDYFLGIGIFCCGKVYHAQLCDKEHKVGPFKPPKQTLEEFLALWENADQLHPADATFLDILDEGTEEFFGNLFFDQYKGTKIHEYAQMTGERAIEFLKVIATNALHSN